MRYVQATIIGVAAGVLLNVAWLAASLAWLAWSSYRMPRDPGVTLIASNAIGVPVPILFFFGFVVAFAWSLRRRPTTQIG